jgi:hypothetical protein
MEVAAAKPRLVCRGLGVYGAYRTLRGWKPGGFFFGVRLHVSDREMSVSYGRVLLASCLKNMRRIWHNPVSGSAGALARER